MHSFEELDSMMDLVCEQFSTEMEIQVKKKS